jgi:hypothetical protein
MAAHSSGSSAIPPVSSDMPPSGWAQWLREMARSINLTSAWAGQQIVPPTRFASLPPAPVPGTLAVVTDSSTSTWGSTVAAGGTAQVLAWWNGTDWTVIGI